MTKEQENAFWDTIKAFKEIGLLQKHKYSQGKNSGCQKILINPVRNPPEKKLKDILAVKELLYHIERSDEHMMELKKVYQSLTEKQLKTLKTVCDENGIVLFAEKL